MDGSALSDEAVGFAFAEAAARGAELVVVHTWLYPQPVTYREAFGDVVPLGYDPQELRADEQRVLAEAVAGWARAAGLDPVEVLAVRVDGRPGGPEAAAREARYEALVAAAHRYDAAGVLLGHTRDDQAETVLLALARGAGPRGLSGMPERRDLDGVPLLRPFLDVARADTRAACAALGLDPWADPHNADPAYARARVRSDALPALVDALGPGVVANLARTAGLLAADNAALAALADAALPDVRTEGSGLSVAGLAELPAAVRTRVLHAWARELGAAPAALSHSHVAALDALVTAWRGQGPVHLPGGHQVRRHAGHLLP
ncbi:tRNA lysidine(34) synthetase TilS [Micromonospora sp. NPDC005313]|uniref:tRNA lysidine(34) synthetase TilS n=1 Tax=Micromonospora sp. NPDC005313 TaxID=3154296 RepID=UPI0033B01C88